MQPALEPQLQNLPEINNHQDIFNKIAEIENGLAELKIILQGGTPSVSTENRQNFRRQENKVVQGRFDGERMTGEDGKKYSVPSNYASKSKLLEGDVLTLQIKPDNRYEYRLIERVIYKKIAVRLEQDADSHYRGVLNDQSWSILKANVVYYKAKVGGQVILLIPSDYASKWGVIDSVI